MHHYFLSTRKRFSKIALWAVLVLVLLCGAVVAGFLIYDKSYQRSGTDFQDDELGVAAQAFFPDADHLPTDAQSQLHYYRELGYEGYCLTIQFEEEIAFDKYCQTLEDGYRDKSGRLTVYGLDFRHVDLGNGTTEPWCEPFIAYDKICNTVYYLYFKDEAFSFDPAYRMNPYIIEQLFGNGVIPHKHE